MSDATSALIHSHFVLMRYVILSKILKYFQKIFYLILPLNGNSLQKTLHHRCLAVFFLTKEALRKKQLENTSQNSQTITTKASFFSKATFALPTFFPINSFHSSVAFHIETSQFICSANQLTGFCI